MKKFFRLLTIKKQKGNLALEQILFITAIVLLSAGVAIFYGNLSQYFQDFSVNDAPTTLSQNLLVENEG